MSQEQAKAAIDKVKSDSVFRKKVMEIQDVEKRIHLLNKEGFDCTLEEIRTLTKIQESALSKCPEDEMVINWTPVA